jgi:predicted dienelactone hydrolase
MCKYRCPGSFRHDGPGSCSKTVATKEKERKKKERKKKQKKGNRIPQANSTGENIFPIVVFPEGKFPTPFRFHL